MADAPRDLRERDAGTEQRCDYELTKGMEMDLSVEPDGVPQLAEFVAQQRRRGGARRPGRNAVGTEPIYSTRAMLNVEDRLFSAYERGRHAGAGVVPAAELDAVLAGRPELGEDQMAMIRSICTSGRRVQCVLGPAGSGKPFALAAAARAWPN
jgi:hypothetical protein